MSSNNVHWTLYLPEKTKTACQRAAARESKATGLNVSVNGWAARALARQLAAELKASKTLAVRRGN